MSNGHPSTKPPAKSGGAGRSEPLAGRAGDRFAGLRVAITGGTSGLGLALVRELLRLNARIAFVARRREGVERVMRECPSAHGIVGDVSVAQDSHAIALQILGAFGLLLLQSPLTYLAVYPPSITSSVPVTNFDASEAR